MFLEQNDDVLFSISKYLCIDEVISKLSHLNPTFVKRNMNYLRDEVCHKHDEHDWWVPILHKHALCVRSLPKLEIFDRLQFASAAITVGNFDALQVFMGVKRKFVNDRWQRIGTSSKHQMLEIFYCALKSGNIQCAKYARSRGMSILTRKEESCMFEAVLKNDNVECLKYLFSEGMTFDEEECLLCDLLESQAIKCLRYIYENDMLPKKQYVKTPITSSSREIISYVLQIKRIKKIDAFRSAIQSGYIDLAIELKKCAVELPIIPAHILAAWRGDLLSLKQMINKIETESWAWIAMIAIEMDYLHIISFMTYEVSGFRPSKVMFVKAIKANRVEILKYLFNNFPCMKLKEDVIINMERSGNPEILKMLYVNVDEKPSFLQLSLSHSLGHEECVKYIESRLLKILE
jgi:hypothetical protein